MLHLACHAGWPGVELLLVDRGVQTNPAGGKFVESGLLAAAELLLGLLLL